jgi:hypothetical protein
MNQRIAPVLAGTACLVLLLGYPIRASDAPVRHSLESDYGFMIGRWKCHVTQAGTPDRDISLEYAWAYDRRILRESMQLGDKLIGEFLTSYDKATDHFKGVGVGGWGGYVVWENRGFNEGHAFKQRFGDGYRGLHQSRLTARRRWAGSAQRLRAGDRPVPKPVSA